MNPRIYTYKVTFPHQGWWYWGVHKEKRFGELYWGSPVTHKDKWDNFEFEKQILEFFDSYEEAREVEKRLINPDLQKEKCLNENSNKAFSILSCTKGGKTQGKRNSESSQIQEIQKIGCVLGGRTGAGGRVGGKRGSKEDKSKAGKKGSRVTNTQKWRCLKTGKVLPPGPLTGYQKTRGIDTSLREKVE